MKIAFISSRIGDDVNAWMLEFGAEMMRLGDEIVFFGRDSGFVEEARRRGAAAARIDFGADYNPLAIRRFYRFFEQYGIQLACLNVQKELRCAGIAARLLGIPVVQRVGRSGDIRNRLGHRIAQRYLVDEILVTSPWIQDELPRRFEFVPAGKVHCIFNGKPLLAAPKSSRSPAPRFVIASRLDHEKGHGNLLQAFYRLRRNGYHNFSCDIFGDGPRREELSRRIVDLDLQNHLRLKGSCHDLEARLADYDYAILASREEGMANMVLKYFSASLPCLLSDGAIASLGIPGLFTPDQGYRFPFKDVDSLAACLQSCLESPIGHYLKQSQAVHKLAAENFNLQSRVDELREYFSHVAEINALSAGTTRAA